jgi:hypothetical protein
MATALQTQTFQATPPITVEKSESHWLDCTASAREEARILFEMMIRKREAVESIRELIAIPPEIEEALTLYARKYPEDAFGIEPVIRFRRLVGEEFERLVGRTSNAPGFPDYPQAG